MQHSLFLTPYPPTPLPSHSRPRRGDAKLRSSYSARLAECLQDLGVDRSGLTRLVDLGCATGLSSLELLRAFPGAHVTGVDLSPHFLAVGVYEQQKREVRAPPTPRPTATAILPHPCPSLAYALQGALALPALALLPAAAPAHPATCPHRTIAPCRASRPQAASGTREPLALVHGLAEATGLASGSVDLVSMCLVCHELPQHATKDIMREAYRILRPGGRGLLRHMRNV